MNYTTSQDLAVAEGADVSDAFHVGDHCRGSVLMPAALTSTGLLFQVSNDKATWDTARADAGTAMSSVTVAANQEFKIPAIVFSHKWARVKFGSTELAARTLKLFMAGPAAS